MVKLSDLKVGNTYYMIDEYINDDFECFPVITEIKVVAKKKGIRVVENIKHVKNDYELYEDFYFYNYSDYEECKFIEITKKNLKDIFLSSEDESLLNELKKRLLEYEEEKIYDDLINYTPPNEYPDWDGEESIMHYIDNYVEEYNED